MMFVARARHTPLSTTACCFYGCLMRRSTTLLLSAVSTAALRMDASAKVAALLREVAALPIPTQRAIASVTGSCVMDAAARPFHWCYDQAVIEEALKDGSDAAFFSTSMSPYYTMKTGQNSCYNDMGQAMLHSLPESRTEIGAPVDLEKYKKVVVEFFGPGTEYHTAFNLRTTMYDPAKRYEKRDPVPGPWQQSSVTNFLEQRAKELSAEGGAVYGNVKSRETDGLVSTLPLIARLALETDVDARQQQEIKKAACLMSTNPLALTHTLSAAVLLSSIIRDGVSYHERPAQLLETLKRVDDAVCRLDGVTVTINGVEMEETYGQAIVLEEMSSVLSSIESDPTGADHTARVMSWGKPCANPGSFQGAMHAFLTSSSFAEGARKVTRAGGCNCSRANLCGALLGSAYGFEEGRGIPHEWIVKTDKGAEVLEMALKKLR